MTIERAVALLTPVFAAVSAWLTGWIGQNLPGIPALSASSVTALEIAGFTGAAAAALKWLHGRSQHTLLAAQVAAAPPVVTAAPPPKP